MDSRAEPHRFASWDLLSIVAGATFSWAAFAVARNYGLPVMAYGVLAGIALGVGEILVLRIFGEWAIAKFGLDCPPSSMFKTVVSWGMIIVLGVVIVGSDFAGEAVIQKLMEFLK